MPVSHFDMFSVTDFISSSLALLILASLAPKKPVRLRVFVLHVAAKAHRQGAALSQELHTPPLPAMHVLLGYRWSYGECAANPYLQWLDNDR